MLSSHVRSASSGAMVLALDEAAPRIAADVFLAPGAVVVGDVEIGAGSSVWFHATLRGDVAPIRIGARTNVQDGAMLHADADAPCTVGDDVTIGHGAIVHGAVVGDAAMIGMGAIVLSHARIGAGAVVAAGAVVPEAMEVLPGVLVMGVPARQKRPLAATERTALLASADRYVRTAARYRAELEPVPEEGAPDAD